jgi:hypothetical protein
MKSINKLLKHEKISLSLRHKLMNKRDFYLTRKMTVLRSRRFHIIEELLQRPYLKEPAEKEGA